MASYSNFQQLRSLAHKYNTIFSTLDSSMLSREGKLTRDMWRAIDRAFAPAINLEDALTRLSLHVDELSEKRNNAMFDSTYIQQSIRSIRKWVTIHVDHAIWSEYPTFVNPWAA